MPHAPTQAPDRALSQNSFIQTDKTSQQFTINTKFTQSSAVMSIHKNWEQHVSRSSLMCCLAWSHTQTHTHTHTHIQPRTHMHPDTVCTHTETHSQGINDRQHLQSGQVYVSIASHPSVAKQLDSLLNCSHGDNRILRMKNKDGFEDLMREKEVRVG